jgi:predicted permease
VGQVAFSLLCLIVSALFFRSIQRAYTIDPGFDAKHLAMFMMNPGQAGYSETRIKDFYRRTRERISTMPGIDSASWASGPPFWQSASRSILLEGAEQRKKSDTLAAVAITVDVDYFRVMGIRTLRGRLFRDSDDESMFPMVIINEALARERWPGGDAIGHRLLTVGDKTWRQVVGVVSNSNYTTLGESPQACVYLPLRQNFLDGMSLYVRSASDLAGQLGEIQRAIRTSDSNVDVSDARTGATIIQQVLWAPMVGVSLLGVFGALALALASIGLYGVMAYSVTQRRREIGVRAALGASRPALLRLVLRDGMSVVLCGIAVGLGTALFAGRALSKILYGVSAADPVSLAAASSTLLAVALLACYLPAQSATRVDPMSALRDN